jgi:hypothetical protein
VPDIRKLLRDFDPRDIAGASAVVELPVSNALLNRLIADALAGKQAPITGVRVEVLDADQMAVHLDLRGPLPALKVALRIDQQPQPDDPILGLRWSVPAIGPLALFASPALSLFKSLPPGIRVDGDRILVNIKDLLIARGFADYLQYLRKLQVHAVAGRLIASFELRA